MHSSDHLFANIGQIELLNIKGIPISAQMAESFTALRPAVDIIRFNASQKGESITERFCNRWILNMSKLFFLKETKKKASQLQQVIV